MSAEAAPAAAITASAGPILEARAVTRVLGTAGTRGGAAEPVTAVDQVSLTIAPGEFVAITGPSGSGKSTLLYMLGALDRPTAGDVYVAGIPTREMGDKALAALRNAKVGFIFQFHFLLPELTALDNVAVPQMIAGVPRAAAREKARQLLDMVDLGNRAMHRPHELSGGQQQRVAIARALANDPALLLGDEPTGNLDTQNGNLVYDWLRERNRKSGQTIVLVTHNMELAARADRVIELVDGRVTADRRTGIS